MYKVSEEDRKEFLNYLAKKPYIEVAGLVARIAGWTKLTRVEESKTKLLMTKTKNKLVIFYLIESQCY